MNRALKTVLGIEIVIGLLWTFAAAMAHGAGGLGAVYLFFYAYAAFAAMFLFAAWVCWKHPTQRRLAAWIMALPIVFWFAPMVIRSLAGEYLSWQQFTALLVIAAIALVATCWIMPGKVTRFIPDGLLRSHVFNWLMLLAIIGGWLFFILVIAYVVNDKSSSASGGEALGLAILLAALYLIWLGVGSFLSATWAWLCLRSDVTDQPRKLNIAQMLFASPGVLLGVAVAVWLGGQGHL